MLKFARAGSGYLIIETTMSATRDYVKTVHYTKDLDKKCINTGPWQETTEADRAWFEKHYRDKFPRYHWVWREEGEASIYTIIDEVNAAKGKPGEWIASIQMNGTFTGTRQAEIMDTITATFNSMGLC